MEALPPCFFQPVVPKTAKIKPSDVNVTLRLVQSWEEMLYMVSK